MDAGEVIAVAAVLAAFAGVAGAFIGTLFEERLFQCQCLLRAHPIDRPIGEIFGQVVALFRGFVRLDRTDTVVEGWLVLVVFAADESVEMFEPSAAGRPRVEGTHW